MPDISGSPPKMPDIPGSSPKTPGISRTHAAAKPPLVLRTRMKATAVRSPARDSAVAPMMAKIAKNCLP
ncbi:hypothetical protein G6F65_023391 [Rhizopus arrhizus]|nr:hypothetical protein G6F65_023391 [Rhizopus arrhizus]